MSAYVIFFLILIVNSLMFFNSINYLKDFLAATLYALNILTIILLFFTLGVQGYFLRKDVSRKPRSMPYSYSFIGMIVACVSIITFVKYFGGNNTIDYPIIFFSCVSIVVVFVYIIILRDHS